MTELQLYKFCQDKDMDWRGDKLIMWIYPSDVDELAELLGDNYLCEDGLNMNLRNGGLFAIELQEICEDFEIEPTNILAKEGE